MSERKFGFEPAAGSLSEIVRLGALAEKHGFDVVWISDHLVDLRPLGGFKADAWSILAYIASMTSRIRLAPGVTDVYRCHPAQTANRVATLDELTAGRVMLGIGAGEAMNIAPYGIEWERARIRRERLIEAVKIIKLLWTSNRDSPAHYDGKYYQLKNAWLDQLPTQNPHPPIYVGAFRSPKLLHAIGETADGWLSSSFSNTPEIFRKRRQIIEEAAKGVGRDPRNLDYVAKFHVVLTEDAEEEKDALAEFKKWIILIAGKDDLKNFGFDPSDLGFDQGLIYEHSLPTKKVVEAVTTAAESIPDEVAKRYVAAGNVDECIAAVDAFFRAGATQVFLCNGARDKRKTDEFLREMGQKIIPYFKSI